MKPGITDHVIVDDPALKRRDAITNDYQLKQELIIHAPLDIVWAFNQDLTNIAEYHPKIKQVDLLSGKALREPGVAYLLRYHGSDRITMEEVLQVIPKKKVVTLVTAGNAARKELLTGYTIETVFTAIDPLKTSIAFYHYYTFKSIKAKLYNLIEKKNIARESWDTLHTIKEIVELESNIG